eukprot:comp46537_c0_seq1/m.47578 comp46537_c0_seq1/g.47578  ORF comp46537_c0_seq1/g.47578 comp46537_c0_seq1/m.47578 type:complete len:146 (-) comp46537_c0_seq1:282-719(-)
MEDAELEGDVDFERHVAGAEWRRMETEFKTTGYREGIDTGKEAVLQSSFNRGYSAGLAVAYDLGQLRGLLASVLEHQRVFGGDLSEEKKQRVADLLNALNETTCTPQLLDSSSGAMPGPNAMSSTVQARQGEVYSLLKSLGYQVE